jgi:hypothetical protein
MKTFLLAAIVTVAVLAGCGGEVREYHYEREPDIKIPPGKTVVVQEQDTPKKEER